jgi:hypothetical protein
MQFSWRQFESFAFFQDPKLHMKWQNNWSDVSCINYIFTVILIACICVYRQVYTRL